MINKLALTLFLLSFSQIYSQDLIVDKASYKALYNLTYLRDSTNLQKKSEEKMLLLVGKKYSLFQSENNRFNDSVKANLVNQFNNKKIDAQTGVNMALTQNKYTLFDFKIIKSNTEHIVIDKIFSDKFYYKEQQNLNWVITDETKQINSYLCQKATTSYAGRSYIAWFSNSIPIADGPYKFAGLPGLIIEMYDTRFHYHFEMLSLEQKTDYFSFDLAKIQKTSKVEFFNALANLKKDIIGQLEQRGFSFDESNTIQIKRTIKNNRNNQIELQID
ncbi:MAG: GLPGLI family protein [Flavobacteriaceae bacterium]|nr:GLPGLI family protein [Flavobacteriaceae bacterium]